MDNSSKKKNSVKEIPHIDIDSNYGSENPLKKTESEKINQNTKNKSISSLQLEKIIIPPNNLVNNNLDKTNPNTPSPFLNNQNQDKCPTTISPNSEDKYLLGQKSGYENRNPIFITNNNYYISESNVNFNQGQVGFINNDEINSSHSHNKLSEIKVRKS